MSYVIQAVLSNPRRPECDQITIPFPIPFDQYDKTIEMLQTIDLGFSVNRDCTVDEVNSRYSVLNTLVGTLVNIDQLAQKSDKGMLAFVGDGINDAPVLARADVGIAMGALGSDAAIEAADVVLMTDEPSKIAAVMQIARKTIRISNENIVFALGVKFLVLILGALGRANMWAAVFADVGVSVIAILNAIRAMRVKRFETPAQE